MNQRPKRKKENKNTKKPMDMMVLEMSNREGVESTRRAHP